MKTKIIICYLFGHKTGKLTDSGYEICSRCHKHEYYDSDTYFKSNTINKIYRYHKCIIKELG